MIVGTKFQLKLTILTCWTKFGQKECFRSKTEKVTTTIEFCIFKFSLGTTFQLKVTILICLTKFPDKEYFRSKLEKVNTTIEFYVFELL